MSVVATSPAPPVAAPPGARPRARSRTAAVHPADPGGWVPVPVCGTGCLPAQAPRSPRERWRIARRMTALVALLLAATVVLPLLGTRAIPRACRLMLRAVGVRVVVRGEPGRSAELLVANHLSWVDVVALSSVRPARLLAKREVRDWPVVGLLAARAGAVFLDRASLRSLPGTVAAAAAVLRDGGTVAAFPEGTTWCGAAAGPLRPAAFQAALDASVPVRPVAVVLRGPDARRSPEAAFVGEQTMLDTLVRGMRLPHVTCELTFLPALAPVGTRRELAARAAAVIGAATGVAHPVRRGRIPRRAFTVPVRGIPSGVSAVAVGDTPVRPGATLALRSSAHHRSCG
ncbi:lysophospholipid acyltransferase family protein [Pseudonocardia sp.]|uniref:lysophospholipid acyltransferase family protein n=1 Tax=Pseudonocardia sp. TaxID=60912 RepID=UPI003D0DB10E